MPVVAALLAACVGLSMLSAPATDAAAAAPIAAGAVTATLVGNAVPALPSSLPNTVAVVANGAPVAGEVAIVVRNGTARAVDNVKVKGVATPPGGGRAVRAKTRALEPPTIAPGELAIARLAFPGPDLPSETTFAFEVTGDRAKPAADPGALEVRDLVLSRPTAGPVAQSLAMTLVNPGVKAVKGPMRIAVMCFGAASNPVLVARTTIDGPRLAAGATMPATVSFAELCPSYLVGAHGA